MMTTLLLLLALFQNTYHRHDNDKPEVCPTIKLFMASSTSVTKGSKVTLNWDVRDARGVDIRGLRQDLLPTGSEQVAINEPQSFTLVAEGTNCTAESVTIKVTPQ